MLEPAVQLERNPPETTTSDSMKSVDASERVNVSVEVSPAFKEETSDVTAMVGLTVSTEKMTELLASEPSSLVLPEELENFELATEITPFMLLSAVGVKVAV